MGLARAIRGMIKTDLGYQNGRIATEPTLIAWEGQYPAKDEFFPNVDKGGRRRVLIKKKAVPCEYPDLHKDPYVQTEGVLKPLAWIPESVCHQCPHHLKRERSGPLRFPRCARLIEDRKGE